MRKSIADLRSDLLMDWNDTNHDPSLISIGSDKLIHWKCHICEYEWEVQAKNRAIHNTGCPFCNKRWNTSFNELPVSYYLRQVFHSVKNGIQLKIKNIKEVDIIIMDLNIVIEYDSLYYHAQREVKVALSKGYFN